MIFDIILILLKYEGCIFLNRNTFFFNIEYFIFYKGGGQVYSREEERWNDGDKRKYLPHLSPLYMYYYYYK